jgi:hypothetical protein
MAAQPELQDLLRDYLTDRDSSWSIGGYGAIAEFHRLDGDGAEAGSDDDTLWLTTEHGAIGISPCRELVAYAYQLLSRHPRRWQQGFALCLPWRRALLARRPVLTELGPDRSALRPRDRHGVLFDLGLALPHVDACVRTDSRALVTALRKACGQDLLRSSGAVMNAIKDANPHRVFLSRLGRVEVYQPIAGTAKHPTTPPGPHTHLLPALLERARPGDHGKPAPAHYRACVNLYPPNPLLDSLGRGKAFDGVAQRGFSQLLERFGDGHFLAEKRRARQAMAAGTSPERYRAPPDRPGRSALRIAIREAAQQGDDPDLVTRWRARYDNRVGTFLDC